ncbi:MAG: FHA domain-containing protein [Verrucomicrobia bacterium]|nr:FHA domain-containing protein [Verrucomicrobiota bacterium]MCH8528114.1 FHA domain-containing protein [Kiritimatiellia bacterium]
MIKLEFLNGPLSGEHRLFRHTPVRIGRESGCDLILEHDTLVSRNHARLRAESGQVVLEDSGASNPILVNGHPLRGEAMLESGDVLTLGGTEVSFRWIDPPRPVQIRRRSALEWIAMAAAGAILLSQAVFLVFYAPTWRSNVDMEVLRPTPTPVPVEPPEEPVHPDPDLEAATPIAPGPDDPQPPSEEAPSPEPTPTPPPVPTPTPMPLTESLTAEEQLERARELIRERRMLEADRLLLQIRDQHPSLLGAQLEYARLMGRQSRFQESIDAWNVVRELAEPGSPEAREAAIELPLMERRLRQLQRPLPEPPPPRDPPAPRPTPPAPPRAVPPPPADRTPAAPRGDVVRNPSLLIQNITMQRFADQSVTDMREIRFTLQHVFGARPVPEGRARVVARFYESDGQRVFPANIPTPEVTVRINREMSRGESMRDIRVIYQVPRGARGAGSGTYYGVVIRVYVGEQLEHELSLPASLIQISQ